MSVYYYSETEQTPDGYAKNPEMRWHYNENHEPVVWNVPGNTLDGKTFVYSTTVVRVSDEYFAMLKEAQRQNMLEDLFDNDTVQINMVKNSATKAEYEQKLSAFAAAAGEGESISFADGKLTLSQAGGAAVTLDYIELNSRVYVNIGGTYSEYMAIDEESGTLREDSSNEYVTILHIFAEAE